ncbi:MAG: hypothetical protein ACRD5F_01840 [Candidatus Acidiferrales bacterium]
MAGLTQFEQGVFQQSLWPPESQPWTWFYWMGERIRERRAGLNDGAGASAAVSQGPGGLCGDEEAGWRMVDEGCPNP